jgi:hypothetical protein
VFIRVVLLLALTFVPAAVSAQTPGRWDVAATAGLFTAYTPRAAGATGYQELWLQNIQGGAVVGHYLTPHLKLEFEGTATTGGTQFRERLISVSDYPYPYPVGSEVTTSIRSLAASVTWQFGHNEWIHPFVQAGVSTDFDRETVRTWEQFLGGTPRSGSPPERIVQEHVEGTTTTRRLRGLLGAGAKVYMTERAFVRTDARWSFDRQRHNLAVRIGAGVDF